MTGHRDYAGLISRVGGLAIDILLSALAVAIVGRGVPAAWNLVARLPEWLETVFEIAADLTPALYFAACWRLTGETFGSWIFGTRVTLSDGRRLGVIRAVLRAAVGIILAPVWFVGLLTVFFDDRRRSLLDMAFGTVVRYVGRPPGI